MYATLVLELLRHTQPLGWGDGGRSVEGQLNLKTKECTRDASEERFASLNDPQEFEDEGQLSRGGMKGGRSHETVGGPKSFQSLHFK